MGRTALYLATAMWLLPITLLAGPQDGTKPTVLPAGASTRESFNRILGYSAWDDDFLYLAFQVNKPTLNGKNSAPYSNPLEDDAILVTLQLDNDHTAATRTAKTITVAVSAKGGAQLYSGAEATPLFASFADIGARLEAIAKKEPDPNKQASERALLLSRLLKFQVNPRGTLRATGTAVPGYTVEIAIPWIDLGGKPAAETHFGFSVVAQSTVPGSPALQSLFPKIKTPEDAANPMLWGELVTGNSPTPPKDNVLTAPRVLGAKPSIDGNIEEAEWLPLSAFEFGERAPVTNAGTNLAGTLGARIRPEFVPRPPRPVVPLLSLPEPTIPMPHKTQKVAPLTLARYNYEYQADVRQSVPLAKSIRTDGSSPLINHPLEGLGPWFSYTRASWHRQQLRDIRRAGIDVVLPVYRASVPGRANGSDRGMEAMVAALQQMRSAGEDYPQVGLYLDTTTLTPSAGEKLDLKEAAPREALYSLIRDFYRRIPAAFCLPVPLSIENGGRRAYPVFLSDAAVFDNLDTEAFAYLRQRFAQEFDNTDLLILGETGFHTGAKLDGYFASTRENGFLFDNEGWVRVASVGAGADPGTLASGDEQAKKPRSRRGYDTYRADWKQALAKRPDWVLIDGWNDYAGGMAIAPTLEYGVGAADLTRVFTRQFAGTAKVSAKIVHEDVPGVLTSGSASLITVRLQNTGIEPWGAGTTPGQQAVGLAYRWRKGGQIAATGPVTPFAEMVLAGQNSVNTLTVSAAGAGGAALPAGEYTLEIGPVLLDKRGVISAWAEESVSSLPVRVSGASREASGWAATLVQSDLPPFLETGSVYVVKATLRNDGEVAWKKAEGARVTLRLYRTAEGVKSGAASLASLTPVSTADATMELQQDVAPGQAASVRLLFPLTDPEGRPLPISSETERYCTLWEVATGKVDSKAGTQAVALKEGQTETAVGVAIAPTPITVVNLDFGVRFVTNGTPSMLPAQKRQPVRLELQNTGTQTWKKDQVRVGYHWYYQDGTEFIWEDETTPLPEDVAPGMKLDNLLAYVTAPPYDGIYYLAWDVKVGDVWGSTIDATRVNELAVREVQVINGKLTFADLSKAYNVDGISGEDDMTDGDFDGKGRTFPANQIPPFANMPITPATLWQPTTRTGPDSPRRISFRLGSKDPKTPNFIACKGQRVDLGKSSGPCRILHILAASTGKDISANLKLIFQEPTSEAQDLVAFAVNAWDTPPAKSDQAAFLSPRTHDRSGVHAGTVMLKHYMITMRDTRRLIAVQLPNEPDIKIAALTLEK